MFKRLLTVILLLLSLMTDQVRMVDRLKQAERLIQDQPSQALSILQTVEPKSIKGRKRQAQYALAMSTALDKNYIDVTSDTLIRQAVSYYDGRKDIERAMLAWYYEGIVLKNGADYSLSVIALEKAERLAAQIRDSIHLGLICRNKADIYNRTNNNIEAIRCRQRAIDYFKADGAGRYQSYAELALAMDYFNNQDYHASDSLLSIIQASTQDSNFQSQCNLLKANLLIECGRDPENAIHLYRQVPRRLHRLIHFGYHAVAFERLSQKDSADYWLSEGYHLCRDEADTATLDYMKARIERNRGHYDVALDLMGHAASVQDSLTRALLTQSVSIAQRDYYKGESLLKEERARSFRLRVELLILIMSIALSTLLMAHISSSRKKDRQLKDQMAILALSDREMNRVRKNNAYLVGSLFSERINHLDSLCATYFHEDDPVQKERIYKQIKQLVTSLRSDPELFSTLQRDLDRYCNLIMTRLQEQVPRINGENLQIITLFFAGFSYEVVQLIMGRSSSSSLKTTRSRLRKEILDANAPDAEFFLKMLEMKSGRKPAQMKT